MYDAPRMKILIIEDEKDVAESIKIILEQHFIVDVAHTGADGEYLAQINDYDLILLDYILPDTDGLLICSLLRKNKIETPILFLTCRDEVGDKVETLNSGADDYLTKPFSPSELIARIRALMRRSTGNHTNSILIGGLSLDSITRTVVRDHKSIRLRRKEFDLLEYLMKNSNRVLTRGMILEHVWEQGTDELSNTVDVHIKYLRDKVDKPFQKKLIKTVHGIGYKIQETE